MSKSKQQQRVEKSVQALTEKGAVLASRRRYTAALRYLNQALKLDPLFPRAYRIRGWVRRERQQGKHAKRDLIQAVELNPDNVLNHLFLGVFLVDQAKFKWGITHLNQVIERGDKRGGVAICAHVASAYAYLGLHRDATARQEFAQLIKIEPGNGCHYCMYDWLTLRLGCKLHRNTDRHLQALLAAPRSSVQCNYLPAQLCHIAAWQLLSRYVFPET